MLQRTILKTVIIKGIGLHSGENVEMKISPAKENCGIYFIRTDLDKKTIIEASIKNISKSNRSTCLLKNNVKVKTIEHFLAACWGCNIDNLEIKLNKEELPILDGSSKEFIKIFEETGFKELEEEQKKYIVKNYIKVYDKKTGAFIECFPHNRFEVNTTIDYNSNILKNQSYNFFQTQLFKKELSSAKTFFHIQSKNDLKEIKKIKGGSLKNSIIYLEENLNEKELEKFNISLKQKKLNKGIINKNIMTFENECVRHKTLDLIGDSYLLQRKIIGKINAFKPGHSINLSLTKQIYNQMEKEEKKIIPKYDLKSEPLMNIERIKQILPHREPFLLIDEIRELEYNYVVGIKYVRIEEDYFRGHFPDEPVMPGVLQIEAMAQTGGILALNTVEDPENYLTYFMKIDNVKFKQKVVPSDVLIFELKLLSPIRRGICHMQGKAYVNDRVVMEAELMAKIAKNDK